MIANNDTNILQLIAKMEEILVANAKLEQRLEYTRIVQQNISDQLLKMHREQEEYISIIIALVTLAGGQVEITSQQRAALRSSNSTNLSFAKDANDSYIISIV